MITSYKQSWFDLYERIVTSIAYTPGNLGQNSPIQTFWKFYKIDQGPLHKHHEINQQFLSYTWDKRRGLNLSLQQFLYLHTWPILSRLMISLGDVWLSVSELRRTSQLLSTNPSSALETGNYSWYLTLVWAGMDCSKLGTPVWRVAQHTNIIRFLPFWEDVIKCRPISNHHWNLTETVLCKVVN